MCEWAGKTASQALGQRGVLAYVERRGKINRCVHKDVVGEVSEEGF